MTVALSESYATRWNLMQVEKLRLKHLVLRDKALNRVLVR